MISIYKLNNHFFYPAIGSRSSWLTSSLTRAYGMVGSYPVENIFRKSLGALAGKALKRMFDICVVSITKILT
jgi:hypothetical protein